MSKFLALLLVLSWSVPAGAQTDATGQPPSMPTFARTVAKSKAGDYLKFRQTNFAGDRTETLTLWQVFQASTPEQATLRVVLTNRASTSAAPLTKAGDDVRIEDQSAATSATLLDMPPLPPGMTMVSDAITKVGAETLLIGPRYLTCDVYERVTKIEVPQGGIESRNRVWWCADLPVTGLVRSENRTSGLQQGASLLELVAFSGMNDPETIRVEDSHWFLTQAIAAVRNGDIDERDRDKLLVKLAHGHLAYGEAGEARNAMQAIRESVYRESLEPAFAAHAVFGGNPDRLKEAGVEGAAARNEALTRLAYNYGNYFLRAPAEDVEAFVARIEDPEAKSSFWAAMFARRLTHGDDAGARAAFERVTTDTGRWSAVNWAASKASETKRLDWLVRAAAFAPKLAEGADFLGTHYRLLDDTGHEKEAFDVARRFVAASVAMPEEQRAAHVSSILVLALYRPWSRVDGFVVRELSARTDTSDPESGLELARQSGGVSAVSSRAQRAAYRGDEAAARRILAIEPNAPSTTSRPAVAALYASGKKAEAVAWARALTHGNGEQPFHAEGTRAQTYLDFAAIEFAAGALDEESRWLTEAETAAGDAQRAMAAYNAEKKVSLYWDGGFSLKSSVPFFLVGVRLTASGAHERCLKFVASLPSAKPGSNAVEDLWKYVAVRAGTRGDEEFAAKVVAALPSTIDANARNWLVQDVARAFAKGGDVAGATKWIAGLPSENQRDLATSAWVVQSCLDGHVEAAESIFTPWIATRGARDWADARVATSMAEAVAGHAERARDLFVGDRFRAQFTGVSGLDRENVLVAVGFHAARAKPDATWLARWVVAVDDAFERAHLSLGMALGLAPGPVPDTFVDPVPYSDT